MRIKLLNIFLILSILITFTGCASKKDSSSNPNGNKQITLTENQEKNAKIKTDTLKIMDIDLQITIPAQFKAQNQSLDRIYSPIDGKLVKVLVEPGSIVKVGQPLAEIKSDDISQIQLEFLERIMDIDAQVKQALAQYDVSLQGYKRENILVKEKISSRSEFEIARSMMQKDRASLDSLRIERNTLIKVYQQRLSVYGAAPGVINRVLSTKKIYPYVTLSSNKNGVVLERKANPGELVEKDKELFSVANLSTIWLVGYAFEKDAPLLHVGENVVGSLEEEDNNSSVKGILSYVSPILDTESKTLEVRADISNPKFEIKPNMYAEMVVKTGKARKLAVPNDAIEKYGDYNFAFVKIKPFLYEERKVTLGQKNEKYSEVISGLKEGEEVVTEGAFSLLGESIKIQEASN